MDIEIRIEPVETLDAVHTADLAQGAFGKSRPELSPKRFDWTYREGYPGTALVSAYLDGRKIGQLAAFFKTVHLNGEMRRAAELVDLFVAPAFRSFQVVSALYKALRTSVQAAGADLIYAYANEAASVLNKRFFRMEEVTQLPVRAGLTSGLTGMAGGITLLEELREMVAFIDRNRRDDGRDGIGWSGEAFRRRLGSPIYRYACATDGQAALIGSPRIIRSVPVLLVVASFALQGRDVAPQAVARLLARLALWARRPLFLYAGWNDAVPFRCGYSVPAPYLKGKFLMQSNFLNSERPQLGRFELLDVDYG